MELKHFIRSTYRFYNH